MLFQEDHRKVAKEFFFDYNALSGSRVIKATGFAGGY
jgi:hypothetical protein